MRSLTQKLIAGSGVTAESHPLLVSLLDFAAQPSGAGGGAANVRAHRQWQAVCRAFRRCRELKVRDSDLRAAWPFPGLCHSDKSGWIVSGAESDRRALVAAALVITAQSRAGRLEAFEVETLPDLRQAQESNGIRELDAPPVDRGKVETPLLPGRRLVVSYPIHGRRVFTALQADECGRVQAIAHEKTRRAAVAAASK